MEKIVALITACGRGNRFNRGEGIPKQYLPLAGIPMLRHSIMAFLNHPQVSDVLCVIHPDDIELYEQATIGLDLLNPVFGGETRQSSIRIGLEELVDYKPNKVLIHDGVRPFVSKRIINGILEKLESHPAVIPAIAVEDTIKKIGDGKIEWTLERENLWRAQTPQGFLYQDILNSHIAFKDLNFTKPKFLVLGVHSDTEELYRIDLLDDTYINLKTNYYEVTINSIKEPKKIVMYLYDEDLGWSSRYEKLFV